MVETAVFTFGARATFFIVGMTTVLGPFVAPVKWVDVALLV